MEGDETEADALVDAALATTREPTLAANDNTDSSGG
jgi:hypothetical protein